MANYNLKLELGQKIYYVWGNPKKDIVVFSAMVSRASLFYQKDGSHTVMYNYINSKLVVNKGQEIDESNMQKYGFCYEHELDTGKSLRAGGGLSDWPVFTSKDKCIEWLRKQKPKKKEG